MSDVIDKTIIVDSCEGCSINFIRENVSRKYLDSHNSKYNIFVLANGRKAAVKNVYTYKGGNVVKTAYLEIYYICREDERALYYTYYTKENSKGISTYKLPYTGQIKL